jgi:dihydrofolate reductase
VSGCRSAPLISRTLDSVQGNARLAEASVAEEAAALDATDKNVSIGGAGLAAAAFELGLVDELRTFRYPVVLGGGTPFLPPVTEDIPLDLIDTRTFGSRVIYARYRRARDDSDNTAVRLGSSCGSWVKCLGTPRGRSIRSGLSRAWVCPASHQLEKGQR